MVTIRLKIRTGFLGGGKVDVSVTRADLVTALAATILALADEGALKIGDLTRALRSGRAAGRAGADAPQPVADPLGLARRPVVTHTTWGLDLPGLLAGFRAAGEALASSLGDRMAKATVDVKPIADATQPPSEPLTGLDLSSVRRKLDAKAAEPPAEH